MESRPPPQFAPTTIGSTAERLGGAGRSRWHGRAVVICARCYYVCATTRPPLFISIKYLRRPIYLKGDDMIVCNYVDMQLDTTSYIYDMPLRSHVDGLFGRSEPKRKMNRSSNVLATRWRVASASPRVAYCGCRYWSCC
jgi:hypothetical protein